MYGIVKRGQAPTGAVLFLGSEESVLQNLALLMQNTALSVSGNHWVFIGIAIAACVLGVEVACIGILIKKFLMARAYKKFRDAEEQAQR